MYRTLLLLLFPIFVCGQNSKLDEKNGFMQYKFGSSPEEYKNISIEIEEGSSKLFSVTGSPIIIDGVEFEYIRLTFVKNKLSAISLQTRNSGGQKFLQSLKSSYGEPKLASKKKNYEWLGNKVQLVYTSLSNKDGLFDFYSKKVYTK